ncbi:hypothetical protein TARUN_7673 [Trichoderma arundinaceum]|uniref:Uncharacterized protein n=1 Tax=Trichoderma arundinaceum TaxID=490622 RepID=A0A395NEL2_TRIAR|nr:hypothetical protein TARUN_7673 [Trichoderma arundinaceum]
MLAVHRPKEVDAHAARSRSNYSRLGSADRVLAQELAWLVKLAADIRGPKIVVANAGEQHVVASMAVGRLAG